MGRNAEFDAAKPQPIDMSTPDIRAAYEKVGRKMPVEPNLDALQQSHQVQHWVENVLDMHQAAHKNGLVERGMRYYNDEQAALREVGERFNDARATSGMSTYHPDHPHLAGMLLKGQFSQNTPEDRRKALVEHAASTGEIKGHLATNKINEALVTGRHPIDVAGRLKLRDYTGSQAHPDDWTGEHDGTQMGWGYTIDRHNHDLMLGQRFGANNRGISGGDSGERRYRLGQAVHHIAHQIAAPKLSVPQFQAVTWGGWRGGYD